MSFEILIKDGARADLAEGFQYYKNISPKLAVDFLDRVDDVFKRIQSGPERYARVLVEILQVKLRRFPYVVSYVFENNRIVVLAVLHGHRDPRQWKDRS